MSFYNWVMSTRASLPIDPILLASPKRSNGLGSLSSNGAIGPNADATRLPPLLPHTSSPTDTSKFPPGRDEACSEYKDRLIQITRKAPLQEACSLPPVCRQQPRVEDVNLDLKYLHAPQPPSPAPKTSLQPGSSCLVVQHHGEMRGGVPLLTAVNHIHVAPTIHSQSLGEPGSASLVARQHPLASVPPALLSSAPPHAVEPSLLPSAIPCTPRHLGDQPHDRELNSPLIHISPIQEGAGNDDDDSEAALLRRYDAAGANTYKMLGYGDNEDEQEVNSLDEEDEDELMDRDTLLANIRVAAVKRTEKNWRAGRRRTQKAMHRAWTEFADRSIEAKKIPDSIIDEISLLLFIEFSAERPKRTQKGHDIPGTRVGASQLKKLFFGALRLCKEQDAANPALVQRRLATSVIVYDSIKCCMDEALERECSGLVGPDKDAPDIRANTFLSKVTDAQLADIGVGFLSHLQLRLCIWGHLAWTTQHASGNRGDNFCALKPAELQPHNMLHPNKRTSIYSVLSLQSEEKAGKHSMRTVINPVYSVFIANLKPKMCPLGAFAFYFHYIYDEKKIIETMGIDWASNKSWRLIRLLHGLKSPTTPFSKQCLYNLYCKAFSHAGFKSRLKVALTWGGH
ncbi:hypothetical protein DFH07DRAFT_955627 [Mycena maculata]|uniref:Uncharacterized protein n=1 Tax=Mycena maculata TaxID=230809 RepID=A0AAD7JLI9_9AGAR|nr:hypothetical protein DFH07DRAFT_955627 [Mycena maculata]